ncbi:MAG: DNA-binding response regulator, partial [Micrococcales bacterium]|nr:DNA-binding response regulator [Micrococcales bacterium]
MANLVLMTDALALSADVLPALALLRHHVRLIPADAGALGQDSAGGDDAILVDGRRELAQARTLCRLLDLAGPSCPVLVVVTEGGLAAVSAEWAISDVVLDTAGPAEVEARLRLARARYADAGTTETPAVPITTGELVIDEEAYTTRLRGTVLDLTYKEFELLKYLAHHP